MQIILLTQGFETQVSDEDFNDLNQSSWHYNNGYARQRNSEMIMMHCVISGRMGLIGLIDHKDRNRLNNQRGNLRVATRSQNGANSNISSNNTSGFKGVCWVTKDQKWKASIQFHSRRLHLGYFDSPIEAAKAYNRAAVRLFGEFASLNQIAAFGEA